MLTLSDPFKIINAKTKFAHEIVLPRIEKISGDDKSSLDIEIKPSLSARPKVLLKMKINKNIKIIIKQVLEWLLI